MKQFTCSSVHNVETSNVIISVVCNNVVTAAVACTFVCTGNTAGSFTLLPKCTHFWHFKRKKVNL